MIADTKSELVAAWERRAIAPPVAAGSVDDGLVPLSVDGKSVWIDGIGAVALDYSSVKSLSDIQDEGQLRERAERAEADLAATKQALAYEQRHAAESEVALAAEHAALLKAEARVKELETKFLTVEHHPV